MSGEKEKRNKNWVYVLAVITWVIAALSFPPSAESLVIKKDLGTLAGEADVIVRGNVTELKSRWEEGKIFTYVTVSPQDWLKGKRKGELTIKVPGGVVGDIACYVTDSPAFKKGEKLFLFLRATDSCFEVAGCHQGKYTIKGNQVGDTGLSVDNFAARVLKEMAPRQKTEKGKAEPALKKMAHEVFNPRVLKKFAPPEKEGKQVFSKVEDEAKKEAKESGAAGAAKSPGWATVLHEDFPAGWPSAGSKWVFDGNPPCGYAWDKDDYKPYTGGYSAWCAGRSLGQCSDLDPAVYYYPNNMNAWMVYGPFDLSDATAARMSFYHWTRTESNYDTFFYGTSTDGNNFYGQELSGDGGGWRQESLSLNEHCGESSVWIGFRFYSDSDVAYEGTFVDEVIIEKYTGPLPEITSIVPDSGPAKAKDLTTYEAAGDSTQVIISGKNFGAAPGEVVFGAGQGDSPITFATIESWSDNQIVCLVPGGASSYYIEDQVGNVFVFTSDEIISDPALFRVTYSYGGGKWPGNKLIYKVNANTADCAGEEIAVQEGASAWNKAGANFNFEYGGATGKNSVGRDGENSIIWKNYGGTDWLARAWRWYSFLNPKTILENDIEFNDYYLWSAGASCPPGKVDVQSTATHELGHWLMLFDLYGNADSEKTMYGIEGPGETKARTLETEDIDGIVYIYGPVLPQGASIKGSVKLEKVNPGDPEPDSPLADYSETEINVIQQGSLVKSSLSAQDGSYLIDGLAAGVYDVHYCRPGWSKVEKNNIALLVNETKELPPLVLVVGDMNQDTEINILDLLWMAAKMGLTPGNPGWEEAKIADVHRDNAINILDLLRVAKNMGVHP